MTSDAKIGLLLGLVVIVIIAFLINGLPSLLNSASSEGVVKTSIASYGTPSVGLSDKADQAVKAINDLTEPAQNYRDIRYTTVLPANAAAEVSNAETQTARNNNEREKSVAAEALSKVRTFADKNLSDNKKSSTKKIPSEYTVRNGDSLWQIASVFLGDGERYYEIVELNRDIIYDAEDISVGMCLKLPRR
jgi:nucleoid-associated protein YgaU